MLNRLKGVAIGALAGCAVDITAAGALGGVGFRGDGLTEVCALAGIVSGIIIAVKTSSSQK